MTWKTQFECRITRFFRNCGPLPVSCLPGLQESQLLLPLHTMRSLRCTCVEAPALCTSSGHIRTPQLPGKHAPLSTPWASGYYTGHMVLLRGLNPGKRPAKAVTARMGTIYEKEQCGKGSKLAHPLDVWPPCLMQGDKAGEGPE